MGPVRAERERIKEQVEEKKVYGTQDSIVSLAISQDRSEPISSTYQDSSARYIETGFGTHFKEICVECF